MKIDLLQMVESGGCSAKIPPKQLEEILKYLPLPYDPNILVDITTHDDAGVYRLNDEMAIVLTTDFFPPVCSDPYEFGQIAAANSISDIYAMGACPALALNIMMFPSAKLPMEVYAGIIRGGFDKATEAGVRIIGGHTIDDYPPKYGLAVTGFVHPKKVITNAGAKPGDRVILTKPLGTGIILAAQRLGMASLHDISEALWLMKLLNKSAAEVMIQNDIKGATDITGFGLLGHTMRMAQAAKVSMHINMKNVPLIGSTYKLVDEGCIPGSSFINLDYVEKNVLFTGDLDYNLKMIACENEIISAKVINELRSAGLDSAAIIGFVTDFDEKYIHLNN
jgi:selenide,water dikinase